MKKILLSAKDLKIGGIEKSLINLINYFKEQKYEITLMLESFEGELFEELDPNIKIVKYTSSKSNIKFIRKIKNCIKRINFIIKYWHKYDISISYATYLISGSFIARVASKNSILWCHADYLSLYKQNKEDVKNFFKNIKYNKFSRIVFVSKKARETFLEVFPHKTNTYYCNNLIDYNSIIENANKDIEVIKKVYNNSSNKQNEGLTVFLNVGRHDEKQKKLTRIIEVSNRLKKENYKFKVIFVGDGQDTEFYKNLVIKYGLQENIIFVGATKNPYPFFKISDCVLLSSDYEGYPVVFLESYILNKPIITTDVSDYTDIENKRGIIVEKDINSIYEAMKNFIKYGFEIKEEFDFNKYQDEVKETLNKILMK